MWFTVTCIGRDGVRCSAGGAFLAVEISAQSLKLMQHSRMAKPLIRDNKDGSFYCSYACVKPGDYFVSVKVDAEHIAGSPFNVQIKPGMIITCQESGVC